MTTKHIVFDWNGTLLDDVGALLEGTNHLLKDEGHAPVSLDYFQEHYDVPFHRLYLNLGLPEDRAQKLIRRNNSSFHHYYEPRAANACLRDGARDVLDYARAHGVQSAILSNHLVEPIRAQLRRLAVESYFVEVLAYASRETQFRDMSKGERLRRYREANGSSEHPTAIVGDSVEEIEIGREQGFVTVAITGGCVSEKRLGAAKPDYLIHTLHELRPILAERGFAP